MLVFDTIFSLCSYYRTHNLLRLCLMLHWLSSLRLHSVLIGVMRHHSHATPMMPSRHTQDFQ